jgi:hypothetical protein
MRLPWPLGLQLLINLVGVVFDRKGRLKQLTLPCRQFPIGTPNANSYLNSIQFESESNADESLIASGW